MRRFAVLGNPIGHSKSPAIHAAFAADCGHDIDYQKVLVEPGSFDVVVAAFFDAGGIGLNVTAPFKGEAFHVADKRSAAAEDAQAANTLWRDSQGHVCAHTTDGSGLLRDLEVNLEWPVANKRILFLGAGGAVRSILGPLCERQPAAIHVANRTSERAAALTELFAGRSPLTSSGLWDIPRTPWDLIINGLSSGWDGAFPDLLLSPLSDSVGAYDLIYSDVATPFMQWAASKGIRHISDGFGMLVEQAADSYEIWQGQRPETGGVMIQHR